MNLENIKKTMGFSLVGEYLRGANKKAFPKSIASKEIGLAVLGESYTFENSLVDIKRFTSPSISCGTLSSLIDTVKTQLDDVYARAEGVFPFDNDKRDKFVTDFARKLLVNSLPIAYGEGADDDELKQDISILLRQSKEEFEKRVKENEEQKEAEKQETLQDNPMGEEGEQPIENPEGEGEFTEDSGEMMDGDSASEIPSDLGPEGEEGEEDDGWESEDDENEESEEGESSSADEFFDGQEDDSKEDENEEDDEEEQEGNGESFGLTKKQNKLLRKYNAQKGYAEEQRFYISGVFSSIPYGTLKGMCEKLLEKEAENFKAIGENFNFKDIKVNSRLHMAHSNYLEGVASVMVLQNRLNIPIK